jgi:nitrite reductase/ring-hydroxylating ferredoxin subunit
MSEDASGLLLLTDDRLVIRGTVRVASERGLATVEDGAEPGVVVIDVERPDAVERIRELRARHPDALIVGHLATPRRDLWLAAERAGCDLVANRGALARKLEAHLAEGAPRRSRYPLLSSSEVPGRLGLVRRVPGTPVGDVAVYQIGGAVHAVSDTCPHAGATLSEGPLEDGIVTCPRHGSRFDVRTGERVRGPADVGIRTFPLEEEGGLLYLTDVRGG